MTVFVLAMLLLYPLMVWPVQLMGERGRRLSHFGFRCWGNAFWLFGMRFRVHGRQNLKKGGPLLLIGNHNSFLDSPAAFVAIRRPFRVLGKVEMTRLPVFGRVYKVACLLVDRNKAASRSASLTAIARAMGEGMAVLIFPEGSMNKGPHALNHFQPGAFQLAFRLGTPVQPVCFTGTRRLLPPSGDFIMRPGVIGVHIGPVLRPQDYASAEELMEACKGFISDYVTRGAR